MMLQPQMVCNQQLVVPGYVTAMCMPQYPPQVQMQAQVQAAPAPGQVLAVMPRRICKQPAAPLNAAAADPATPPSMAYQPESQGAAAAVMPAPAYECTVCNKLFKSRQLKKLHEQVHQIGERPHECRYCGKRFAVKGNATVHERTHTNEKPHKCRHCDKRFTQRSNVTVHERTHSGEKPYGCTVCAKRFSKSSDATRHERSHTGERPFACSFCSKWFSESGTARRHERTHKGEMEAISALTSL